MSMSTSLYQRPTHLDLIVSIEPLFPKHSEASSEKGHRETSIHRALNADVAGVRKFPIKGRRIDVFPEGGGIGVLNEDTEKFRGCFGEVLFDILLDVDDER